MADTSAILYNNGQYTIMGYPIKTLTSNDRFSWTDAQVSVFEQYVDLKDTENGSLQTLVEGSGGIENVRQKMLEEFFTDERLRLCLWEPLGFAKLDMPIFSKHIPLVHKKLRLKLWRTFNEINPKLKDKSIIRDTPAKDKETKIVTEEKPKQRTQHAATVTDESPLASSSISQPLATTTAVTQSFLTEKPAIAAGDDAELDELQAKLEKITLQRALVAKENQDLQAKSRARHQELRLKIQEEERLLNAVQAENAKLSSSLSEMSPSGAFLGTPLSVFSTPHPGHDSYQSGGGIHNHYSQSPTPSGPSIHPTSVAPIYVQSPERQDWLPPRTSSTKGPVLTSTNAGGSLLGIGKTQQNHVRNESILNLQPGSNSAAQSQVSHSGPIYGAANNEGTIQRLELEIATKRSAIEHLKTIRGAILHDG